MILKMPCWVPSALKGRFDWLPVVNVCCFCIRLKTALALIGLYGIIRSFAPMSYFLNCQLVHLCAAKNAPSTSLAVLDAVVALNAFIFFCGSVMILFMMCMDFHLTKVYVLSTLTLVPLTIIFWVLTYLLYAMARVNACYVNCIFYNINVDTGILYSSILSGITYCYLVEGIWLIYCAIVVNSYDSHSRRNRRAPFHATVVVYKTDYVTKTSEARGSDSV